MAANSPPPSQPPAAAGGDADPLVQYLVVRRDLIERFSYSWGAVIANSSHASLAAIARHLDEPEVRDYVAGKQHQMHKVVLGASDEADLLRVAETLSTKQISHHLWVEHPELLRTCLATRPYRRSVLQPLFKGLRLFK